MGACASVCVSVCTCVRTRAGTHRKDGDCNTVIPSTRNNLSAQNEKAAGEWKGVNCSPRELWEQSKEVQS